MIKMTPVLLSMGRSDLGGFSNKQMDLLEVPYIIIPGTNRRAYEKSWQKKIMKRSLPDEAIAEFISLKNAHLTPALRRHSVNVKARKDFKKAIREAEAKAASPTEAKAAETKE